MITSTNYETKLLNHDHPGKRKEISLTNDYIIKHGISRKSESLKSSIKLLEQIFYAGGLKWTRIRSVDYIIDIIEYINGTRFHRHIKNTDERHSKIFGNIYHDFMYTEDELYKTICDGHGVYLTANGSRYEGGYCKGEKHGLGVYTTVQGKRFKDRYEHGKLILSEEIV